MFHLVFIPNFVCLSSFDLKLAKESHALMCCGRLFHSLIVLGKKEWRWELTEDWGICRLSLMCLPTGMRPSRRISIALALALKRADFRISGADSDIFF